jgi:hypothetical protein
MPGWPAQAGQLGAQEDSVLPITAEELKIIIQCRDLMARKGIQTLVMVLDMTLKLCVIDDQQTAGDDQSLTGTTQLEEPSK